MAAELDPTDREFFAMVSRAAHVNPFGDERDALDARIAESEGRDPELIDRLLARVEERLVALAADDLLDPSLYAHRDGQILEHAILFETFHRVVDRIDAMIEAQLAAGDEPIEVPFAAEVLARLRERGVGRERSIRMLGLFWQMRRAYHFIVTRLTGVSPSMKRLRQTLWSAVFTHDGERFEDLLWDRLEDFSLIIRGETGTGKGQAAAAIGRSGYVPFDEDAMTFQASFTELFVPINLSQFPVSLIESELFGHRKGAFTGAVDSHAGAFSRCRPHGAIFLDEIGEVSIPVQIKLLRVLQDRLFCPVGSHEERRFDGRVIAATHRDLDAARRDGRFRNDFYYRLCSDVIEVPPLRVRLAESPEELVALTSHLVERIVGQPDDAVVERVVEVVRDDLPPDYAWPGNVRELEQCVRRVLLTDRFGPDPAGGHAVAGGDWIDRAKAGSLEARDLVAHYCAALHERHGTYEEVARITGLDRRTVKKYVQQVNG